jgi:hypothetical protein
MRIATSFLVIAVLLTPTLVLAHGGGEHVMGIVKKIDAQELVVETSEQKNVQVTLDDKTQFERSGASSTARELRVGDRVVVHCAKAVDAGRRKAMFVKSTAGAQETADAGATKPQDHKAQ